MELDNKIINMETSNYLCRLGSIVKHLRHKKKLTQELLAFMCNTDKSYINKIEHAQCDNITLKSIVKLSLALGENLLARMC